MNEDFYYFFSLFKDNCVFNEALNTARYRYGLDPQRYLNLYSDIVNDPGNIHLIEDELSMFFNIDFLSHNEYVLLLLLKNIIVDSRKIICGKDSDKLYEIQEINADLLYLMVKLLLQKATEELSNSTVRCSLIENATNINIDSKTNTRLFKKSFLHRIFTVTDTLPQNVSLPIRVIFAPVQFSSLKTINISPYKNIYDCPDIHRDARFIMLKSVSDNETAQFMMELMNKSYKARGNSSQATITNYSNGYSSANFNTFYTKYCNTYKDIFDNLDKISPESELDTKDINGIRLINDYLSERIYHFNYYREFFDLIDSAPEEYELDYNQLLSIATLDNVFYTDKLFNYVKKKDHATTLYHTPLHNEGISSQMTNYDSSFMACRESVDLLNYIYYPVIFTLSYSLVQNNISFGELAGFLGKLSAHAPYKEMLDTINLSKPASKPINPSFRNTETINRLFSESLYIIKRRYYRNTSPYTDYFLKTFYSADSPLKFRSDLIPAVLPRPASLNSDEYKTLLNLERK